MTSFLAHNIEQSTYAKLGEVLLRWAEADGFLGNSINWANGYSPDSANAAKIYRLPMIRKIKVLEKFRAGLEETEKSDIDRLLCEIRKAMEWKIAERDAIAHGTALQLEDGSVVLRTDKGHEIRVDRIDDALMHARCISNLAIQLNLRLAAPWTKNLFRTPGKPS